MRLGVLLSLAFALMLSVWSTPSLSAAGGSHGTTVVALQQQPSGAEAQPGGKLDIDINVNHDGSARRWYTNPMWIAIGALAVIVLILLIVMAARGGGTTVIKE